MLCNNKTHSKDPLEKTMNPEGKNNLVQMRHKVRKNKKKNSLINIWR